MGQRRARTGTILKKQRVGLSVPRQRGIGNKAHERAVRSIAREREVRGRVGAGQVKVGDVASLCDLKDATGPASLGKGLSRLLADKSDLGQVQLSDPPKSWMVPLNVSCSSTSQPLLMMVSVACG